MVVTTAMQRRLCSSPLQLVGISTALSSNGSPTALRLHLPCPILSPALGGLVARHWASHMDPCGEP